MKKAAVTKTAAPVYIKSLLPDCQETLADEDE